jgi:hypothetical protein
VEELMKIKNYIWLVLVIGFTGIQAAAQRVPSKLAQGLSASERAAAVDTSLATTCSQKTPKIARVLAHNAQVFSAARIQRTLSGVWRGRVKGNYEKQYLAKDGFVNVDYYLIVDAARGEALVFEQFGSTRAAPPPKPGAPVWSYVTCGRENYVPRHPAQIHEFHKVSDNIEDARELLRISTGLTFADKGELVLSDVWQKLVETKYFDDPERSLAYAGGLFKPFSVGNVPVGEGGSLLEMDMHAEYRGSGMTAASFERGVPIRGFERGKFLGVETNSGGFLVATNGIGREIIVAKAAEQEENPTRPTGAPSGPPKISFAYDKVVIGPLAQ